MTPVSHIECQVDYVKALIALGFWLVPASDDNWIYTGPTRKLTLSEAESHFRDPFVAAGLALILCEDAGYACVQFGSDSNYREWQVTQAGAPDLYTFTGPEGTCALIPLDSKCLDETKRLTGPVLITSGTVPIPSSRSDKLRQWINPPTISNAMLAQIQSGRDSHAPVGPSTELPELIPPNYVPALRASPASDYVRQHHGERRRWLVEGFLAQGSMVIWSGHSKAGKSTILTALAMAIVRGDPFLDMKTCPAAILWMAYEESFRERQESLLQYGEVLPDKLFICHDQAYVNTKAGLASLRAFIKKEDIKLVILDPLYVALQVENLSDGKKTRDAMQPFKLLLNELDVSAILIHHTNKNTKAGMSRDRAMDSGQILAAASQDILMDVRMASDGSRTILLASTGRGAFANRDYVVSSSSATDFQLVEAGHPGSIERNTLERAVLAYVKAQAPDKVTAQKIADHLDEDVTTVRNALTLLGRAKKLDVDKESKPFRYSFSPKKLVSSEETE